ncbi:hypothetical protein [Massilia sp. SYSU DXS3249]
MTPHTPVSLPTRLGLAGDIVFITTPALAVLNPLLVYEQLVLPLNQMVFERMLADFSSSQLLRLVKAGRLLFCPEMTARLAAGGGTRTFDRGRYLDSLRPVFPRPDDDIPALVGAIDEHLLVGALDDFTRWTRIRDEAVDEFMHVAARPGYAHLIPPSSLFSSPRDRLVGLQSGLGRVNDLAGAGVLDLQFDKELPVLLEIVFPAKKRPGPVAPDAAEREAIEAVEKLHDIRGLPLLRPAYDRFEEDVDRFIDIVLSEEAAELRHWLSGNVCRGMDVRQAYIEAGHKLPSQHAWAGWLKFGVVTSVSTVIGGLIADPAAGLAVGTGLGAFDHLYGEKALQRIVDPYHPDHWLSYLEGRL